MARIVGIDADAKNDVRSATLWVTDNKGGPSQILKRPLTKLVLLWKMSSIPSQKEP